MKRPSLVKRFLLLASMMGAVTSFAQTTTTIDYAAWSTPECNAFGNSPTINGLVHKTITGQPQYSGPNTAISLQCQYNGSAPYGTRYEIQYNFLANHQYTITVLSAAITNNYFPMLNLELVSNVGSGGSLCNGPSSITEYPNSQNQGVGSTTYINFGFSFNPTQNNSRLYVGAIPDYGSMGTTAIQWIYIKKIVITDNTPPTPTFNLVASSNTRVCGSANAVTFTVQNPGSAPVSQYKFYPESGKWLYNGNPAPAEIIVTPPTNAIVLTPVTCASNTSMTAKAVWNGQNVNMNAQSMAVTLPAYSVSGPSSLPMVSANYQLMGNPLIFPTPPAGLPCNATVSWGNSNQSAAFLYINTPTQVGISPNTQYPGFPVTIVLSAQVQACGQSTTVNRNITITDPFFAMPMSGNSYQDNDNALTPWAVKSVSPNPTDGRFTIELSKSVMDASIYIRDITGNLVSTQKRSGQLLNVDISTVSAGTYLVEIVSGSQSVVEKIIKK